MRPTLLVLLLAGAAVAQDAGEAAIRLNQVGFYPYGPKHAVVVGAGAGWFEVRPDGGGEAVLRGDLGPARTWPASGETVRQADFSALTASGRYRLVVEGVGASHPFAVRAGVHQPLARAALKGYYHQRASTPLDARWAGPWARAAGHPDNQVLVHASAATGRRPAGTVIASPRGWYDAGDYNKYIVTSGIAVGTLFSLLEWSPAAVAALEAGIPESGDVVPDVLDEALWNVRWMLTMQDADGGVYHKLTSAAFSGEVLPADDPAVRYVVQKSTAATLDFAAALAHGARVVAAYPEALPGLADSLQSAALAAWTWARAHPAVLYDQARLNAAFDPDITTGEYGDGDVSDEFDWAAMELYLTTRADSFLAASQPLDPVELGTPWWGGVRELGYHSLLAHRQSVAAEVDTARVRDALLALADRLVAQGEASPYGVSMTAADYYWGSNSVAANQGITLVLAYRLTGEACYLAAAIASLDYLLGRNATGYSFVTGLGSTPPRHPHHRPSRAMEQGEGFTAGPVPGLLAGGPNAARQDGCASYPSTAPARSYTDDWCSYASNEIAINWNAPLVHLAVAVEAAMASAQRPPFGP